MAGAGYLTLTLFFTWPLALHLSSVLPHDTGDPLFGTYLMWWNAHAVPLTDRWWNAPFFWPSAGAMGFSEHLLGLSLLSTPLQWAGADPISAYNITFLLSFPLSALAMHALAFSLVRRHEAAALAGLLFGFSPYRTAQISHIQILWTFWMPLVLLGLHEYAREGRRRWLVLFAAAWLGQALSNGYFLLFLPVLVACWVAWFLVSRHDFRRAAEVVTAAAIASVPLVPILMGYRRIHEQFGLERGLTEIRQFSADVMAFWTTAPSVWAWQFLSKTRGAEQELFPGITPVALILAAAAVSFARGRPETIPYRRTQRILAVLSCLLVGVAATLPFIGPWQLSIAGVTLLSVSTAHKPLALAIWCAGGAIVAGVRLRHSVAQRSLFGFYVMAALLMYVLSLGPEPVFRGAAFWYKPPYAWLMELPGYGSVRVPARFAMLGTLCLAVAAALAMTRLASRMPPRAARAFGAACCAVALVDCWMVNVPLPAIPERIRSLEAGATLSHAIVELPFGDVSRDLGAMYRSMYHQRPVVNGYGGFAPPAHIVLTAALGEGDTDAVEAFGVPLTVVVDSHADNPSIFTIEGDVAETQTADGPYLAIRAATASSEIGLQNVTDGNRNSRWDSGGPQNGSEWIAFDLGAAHRVRGLMLAVGPGFRDYPRAVAIDVSLDGQIWTTIFEGRSAARAVAGAHHDPRNVPIMFWFPPSDARWIRARQTGRTEKFPWSISEAAVLAAP